MQCIRIHVPGTGYMISNILKIKHVHKQRDARMQLSVSALLEASYRAASVCHCQLSTSLWRPLCAPSCGDHCVPHHRRENQGDLRAALRLSIADSRNFRKSVGVGDDKPAGLLIFRPRASFRLELVFPTSRHPRRTMVIVVFYPPLAVFSPANS